MTAINTSATTQAGSPRDFSWRSDAYAWTVVALLTIALTFSMVDRMILTLLVGPIKADFGLSDTQISLLHGLAFTVLYVIVGLPMGRLADRYSRRGIAGWSIFVWSIMTAACGIATTYAQLFLARVGVGVGEAGLSPAANSIIADYFPPEKLARPIAFFSIGGSAGVGLAFIFGGAVVDYVSNMATITLPVVGVVRSWHAAFFVVGLPGAIFALAFLFVREPPRAGRQRADGASVSLRELFGFLSDHFGFFSAHFMGSAMAALVVLSIHAWMPTYLVRSFGITAGEAGVRYGMVVLVSGVAGLLVAGAVADRLAALGRKDSHILVALAAATLAAVPAMAAPLVGSFWVAMGLAGVAVFGFAAAIALAPVALQIVVPNEMRGQVYAVYLLTISLLGYAIGPMIVALLTDNLFADEKLVGQSMALVALFGGPASALFFASSCRRYARMSAAFS